MRINKFLASCGVGSRRACEEYIIKGRIKINGIVVRDLSTQINEKDIVHVDGKLVSASQEFIYIILNKPKGYVTTCNDEKGRKTVLDLIDKEKIGNARIFPVGRLDYDTGGLLILTNDGEFTKRVTHPSSKISKTYVATLNKEFHPMHLKNLEQGILIDDQMTHPAKANRTEPNVVELTITEGRNRQVRKMFEALGYRITALRRVAIAGLKLGSLKSGEFKIVSKDIAHSVFR
ncbi:MAG: rRNA pseudouridine synthase [Firmicutes bacterium]|nr:rRNA pseudouridine synthase [Bacillota bacterium]